MKHFIPFFALSGSRSWGIAICGVAILFSGSFLKSSASDMNEETIPSGWELSTTLALFRNLPLMGSETFPASQGDVYFSKSEEFKDGKTQTFINTYRFYRKTDAGNYLAVSVTERHEMSVGADGNYSHRVFDVSRSLESVDKLPSDAKKAEGLSMLLSYIFDHREALLKSEAGEIARQLNYGTGGRLRSSDYSQPRVSFVKDGAGKVEKFRVYGLSALMSEGQARTSKISQPNQVLEISVNPSGAAQVSVVSLESR